MVDKGATPTETKLPPMSRELRALRSMVKFLEKSDAGTRRRIMAYLNSRYPTSWSRF